MRTDEFDFHLPEELIAQTPVKNRKTSRLLVVNKKNKKLADKHFYNIVDYFKKGDVLVRNNTRVIPARLFGIKEETNAHVELLLLKQDGDIWQCLVGNAKVVKLNTIVSFGDGRLKAQCVEVLEKGLRRFKMIYEGIFFEILNELGNIPLPPYIHEKLEDKERYQTVYSKVLGSAAAPTAGLHFTDDIFDALKRKGVQIVDVTLHVGLGTFKPIDVEVVEEHIMHSEFYMMDQTSADILNHALKNKQRIITVGTTSTRTIEAIYKQYHTFKECSGYTDIFIYPGYKWQVVDAIITNFHLPKSTLIMMISSFAGKDFIFKAYQHAIKQKYRFFSFGDCMFITNEDSLSSQPKINYYQKCIDEMEGFEGKKNLLLHACCAPCISFPLEFLIKKFNITIYYNNSNIYPENEYIKRLEELRYYVDEFNKQYQCDIPILAPDYDNVAYTKKLEPLKDEKEGGKRCFHCYAMRMDEAYNYATKHNFDYFTTVMTISRQKDSQKLNQIGANLEKKYSKVKYLYSDFKKNKGIDRRNELVKEKNLYAQHYCGCIYSMNNE